MCSQVSVNSPGNSWSQSWNPWSQSWLAVTQLYSSFVIFSLGRLSQQMQRCCSLHVTLNFNLWPCPSKLVTRYSKQRVPKLTGIQVSRLNVVYFGSYCPNTSGEPIALLGHDRYSHDHRSLSSGSDTKWLETIRVKQLINIVFQQKLLYRSSNAIFGFSVK